MVAKRKPAKKKPVKRAAKAQAKKKLSAAQVARKRRAAAKKGWETRRRKQAELERERKRKAAKKKPRKVTAKKRSAAAKKGWETRRARELAAREDRQLDERAPLLVRKDLRPELPAKLEELSKKAGRVLNEAKEKMIAEEWNKISRLTDEEIIKGMRKPDNAAMAQFVNREGLMEIAYADLVEYWTAKTALIGMSHKASRDTVQEFFSRNIYGTEMEARQMADDTFAILTAQYNLVETDESLLRRRLNDAQATPQFDAIMTSQADMMGITKRALYSWFFGSPDGDIFA